MDEMVVVRLGKYLPLAKVSKL